MKKRIAVITAALLAIAVGIAYAADVKISELTVIDSLADADELAVHDASGSDTNAATMSQVQDYFEAEDNTWTGTNTFSGTVSLPSDVTLPNESVDSDMYVDGSIDNAHLADDAVDSDELASGSVDYAHLSAGAKFYSVAVADLDDTSTPSVLTTEETTNKQISNYKATGADHVFTMPAAHAGGNIIFTIGDEFQVDIEPNTSDLFYLNGTAMAADEHIENDDDTLGERIVGYCVNINGTLRWMFYSADSNWAEATE